MNLQFGDTVLTPEIVERLHVLGFTPEGIREAVSKHKDHEDDGTPAIYVGTYAKYNAGSLKGLWVYPDYFETADECLKFLLAIHADEQCPELMAQDCENLPDELYTEALGAADVEAIFDYVALCREHGYEAVGDFVRSRGFEYLDNFENAFIGQYDSEEDYAEQYIEASGILDRMGEFRDYFDFKAFTKELFFNLEFTDHGYVFAI